MGYRAIRQLILILIPLSILVALIFAVYIQFLPEPTCTDSKLNQDEVEIDCGGGCIPCLFKHIETIEVHFAKFDELAPGLVDVVAEIKNPNTKLLAKNLTYEITLRDDAGVIMQKLTGNTFLYAGETAYVVEGGIPTKRKVGRIDFSINNGNVDWILGEATRPLILNGERQTAFTKRDDLAMTLLKLKLFNQSLSDFRDIEVGVIIFDDKKNVLAINKTEIPVIVAGENIPVTFTWPGEFTIDTDNVVVQPRVRLTGN